jgi:hypothetical protein
MSTARVKRRFAMIVVGTGSGVHRFIRSGGGWRAEGSALDGVEIADIASDPSRSGRLVAAAREQGIFESDNGGATWTQAADVDAWSVAVAADGTAYAGTRPTAIHHREPDGVWEPLNLLVDQPAYDSWTFPTAPHLPNIRGLAFSPRDAHTMYAAVEVGGIIASQDDGATWTNHREGIHLDVHSLVAAPGDSGDEDVLYAATGRGFYRSFNAGAMWEPACDGLLSLYLTPIAAHTADPHTLIVSATQGRPRYWRTRDSGAEATIYRSGDGGGRWQPVMNGLPELLTGAVYGFAVDPTEPGALYAAVGDGQVLASGSFGDEWSVLASGLPPAYAIAVV